MSDAFQTVRFVRERGREERTAYVGGRPLMAVATQGTTDVVDLVTVATVP